MIRSFFILLIFLFINGFCIGQEYQMQISSIKDKSGNSPSATFDIVKDHQGFMWFGTIDGLTRFDGFNYKIFRNDPENQNSLSNNTIRGLAVDKNGIIWIATQGGGLDAFNPQDETFRNFKHTGKRDNELRGNSLWSVMIDKKNDVWIGIAGIGVDKLEQKTGKITHYNVLEKGKKILQDQIVRSILEDESGQIWVGIQEGGLSRINPKTGEVKNYSNIYGNDNSLAGNSPYKIILSEDKKLWIATFGGGVNILDPATEKFSHVRPNEDRNSIISDLVYSITERVSGEYWIATEYGLSIYYSKTGIVKNIQQSNCNRETISENRLRILFVDNEGIIWAGTESGVEKFVTQTNFKVYSNFFDTKSNTTSAIVKTIASDDNYYWIGFIDHGLIRYSPQTNTSKHYFSIREKPNVSVVSNINAILYDSNKNLWVADWNYGLLKYNRKEDSFSKVSNAYFEDNRLSDNRIQRIIEGRRGILWLATEGGLNRYDISNDEFQVFLHDENDTNSLSSNSIQSQALVFDKDSNLWVGTWSYGLNKMEFTDSNRTKANIKRWLHDPNNQNSLPNNNVISLLYDTTALWIGTFGGGLSKLDLKTGKFSTYTTKDGLLNNIIFAIFKDKNKNLWLSTDHGISMFDPANSLFYNYTQEDGLQDNHFFWGAAYRDKQGVFYFGGIKGINSFIPEEVKPDTTQAKPVIVDIKLFNKSLDRERYNSASQEVSFYYYENFISFEFAALDYKQPKNNSYKFKLDGFDKDWIYSNDNNNASYTNLPPGRYTFMLQVSNSDGVWSKETCSLKIIVTPPWWKTTVAIILFIAIIIGLVYGTHLVRINILKKQKKNLEKQVEERTYEISQKNDELKERYEEILTQEEEIREQTEELRSLSDKLQESNHSLSLKVKERTIELENALVKAEDSQKLISAFLSNLSHEIRTPLNAIMGFSQLIGVSELSRATTDHYTGIIEQNVNTLLTQIENIMDVAKLHTGQYKLKESTFYINELFNEINNEFNQAEKVVKQTIELKLISTVKLLKMHADKNAIKNIIFNLLENAIKFTEKGRIEFGVGIEPGDYDISKNYVLSKDSSQVLRIFVSDTGIGIAEIDQENIFDAFRKIENNHRKIYRGSGVGLALVKNLVEKLHGTIDLQSKPDVGTSFIITFPVSEA